MTGGLKPYPEYRQCDLAWLKTIPRDWSVMRGKGVFEAIDIRSRTGSEELLTVSASDGVVPRRHKTVTMFMAKSYVGHKLCWSGDLVVNSLWAWMQGLGVAGEHGLISSAYSVYRPRLAYRENSRFFHHLLRSAAYKWELLTRSKGVWLSRLQLSDLSFMDMPILLPPPEDQAAIVRFVEYVGWQVGRAIRAKKKLIALLNEQKQVIIHRAVTRGVEPTVPLKSSGIPWLSDIPEHWKAPLLGRCIIRVEQGWSPVAAEGELAPDQWAVLMLSSVRRGIFNPSAIKPISPTAEVPTGIEVANGDFLLTRSNTRERVGDVCIVRSVRPGTILCDLIYRLHIRDDLVDPQFLAYQLLSPYGRTQIERDARGSSGTMPKISQRHIKSWRVLLPPIGEQRSIVSAIDGDTIKLNDLILDTQKEIDLIREYQIRLIADIVTGQLDVGEVSRTLPAAVDAPELSVEAGAEDGSEELLEAVADHE